MSLKVHTRFPGGNAADVEIIEQGETPEVRFASDPCGGPETLWFCFRLIESTPAADRQTKVRVTWKHFDNVLGAKDSPVCLAVSKAVGQGWTRLKQGEESRTPDGRRQLSWWIPHPAPQTEVAFCFPYGLDDVHALLERSPDYWQTSVVGLSQAARPLVRLSNSFGELGGTQPGIYLIARQHSGETPGSWVLDGFLRHLAQSKKAGYVVWAVPFADVDGVSLGEYGKDAFPYDLNRAWGSPPMRHETLVLRRDVARWKSRCHPILALDLHAPGACESDGVYAYAGKDEKGPLAAEETKWCNMLKNELQAEFAAPEFKRAINYRSRWETPNFAMFMRDEMGVPALSLETPYGHINGTPLTQKSYREIGRRLALGVLHRHG